MASEIERIGEECRRYADRMVERMAESRAQREARSRQMAEQSAAEMRKLRQGMAEAPAEQTGRAEERRLGGDRQEQQAAVRPQPNGNQPPPDLFRLRQDEIERLRNLELRRQQEMMAPSSGDGGVPGQHAHEGGPTESAEQLGDLDPREAIARAAAARRRNSVVAPIDDDGDYEADYYRRNNWLV
ncbi:hypothetical protein [Nocardia sp. NPDC024068]|uniref:hypothetical protein n=1 Tax=Nocardia sp. NPDC024068 TaxID=3157197 RepID=UPI0033E1ED13